MARFKETNVEVKFLDPHLQAAASFGWKHSDNMILADYLAFYGRRKRAIAGTEGRLRELYTDLAGLPVPRHGRVFFSILPLSGLIFVIDMRPADNAVPLGKGYLETILKLLRDLFKKYKE